MPSSLRRKRSNSVDSDDSDGDNGIRHLPPSSPQGQRYPPSSPPAAFFDDSENREDEIRDEDDIDELEELAEEVEGEDLYGDNMYK